MTGTLGMVMTAGTGMWGVTWVAVLFHRLLLILVTENMIIFTDE